MSLTTVCSACALVALQLAAVPRDVSIDTILRVRLNSAVSSQDSRPGDPVDAVLIAPVGLGARVLPAGAILRGAVTDVTAHAIDRRAMIRFSFDRLEVAGRSVAVSTRVRGIDNAREVVDDSGMILGPATQADSTRGRVELLALAVLVPELFAIDVAGSRLIEGEQVAITYRPGVELEVAVTRTFDVSGLNLPLAAAPAALPTSLQSLVATLPTRTEAGQPARPADVINFVFIGSSQSLAGVFQRAQWNTAEALSLRADVKTFLAIASRESYQSGPVSRQALDGRAPDYVFQKQNNTFAMRHHVRIWRRGSWEGRPLWVGAATHDIGVKFAVAERTFTHRVETQLDLERDKIVNDLMFAGLPAANYIDRPALPRSMRNATQDDVTTDGRLAVMWLNDSK